MVGVVFGDGEVEIIALDAAGEAGVAAFPVEGVVGEDERPVDGRALGFVEGCGIPVGEVASLDVGEGEHQRAPSRVDGFDTPSVGVDAGDGGSGAVEDEDAVRRALSGCIGVHLSLSAGSHPQAIEQVEHRGALQVVELARHLHVGHLTYVSGMFVGAETRPVVLGDQAKKSVEQALQQSGIPFTIFRPTYFMENLPKHIQGKRALLLGKQPHPLHLVAASDFSCMVSRTYQEPLARNRTFFVRGPEALTLWEALHLYCSRLSPDVRVTTMPLWFMSVVDTLFLRKQMRRTVQMMQVLRRTGEIGDSSETNRILGMPTTTLRAWCEQHRPHVANPSGQASSSEIARSAQREDEA